MNVKQATKEILKAATNGDIDAVEREQQVSTILRGVMADTLRALLDENARTCKLLEKRLKSLEA